MKEAKCEAGELLVWDTSCELFIPLKISQKKNKYIPPYLSIVNEHFKLLIMYDITSDNQFHLTPLAHAN